MLHFYAGTCFLIVVLVNWLRGKLAPCHILIKEAFCSFARVCFLLGKKACDLLYMCRSFFSVPPPPSPLRSVVFVLYVSVYQRVPTVSASTYKVMYWHGRLLGDRAVRCAAEGRLGRWGNTAFTAWEEEAVLIARSLALTPCYVSERAETREMLSVRS